MIGLYRNRNLLEGGGGYSLRGQKVVPAVILEPPKVNDASPHACSVISLVTVVLKVCAQSYISYSTDCDQEI